MAQLKIPIILDDETRPIWESALRAKKEVDSWPAWKRGYELEEEVTDRKTDPDAASFNRRVSELSKELSSLIKIAQAKGWDLSINYEFQKEGSGGLYFHQGEWSSSTC